MFRILMIALMFLICTFIGFYIAENFKQRSLNLKEVQKAFILLNSEIVYANTPLPQALMDIGEKVSAPISKIFTDMSGMLENGEVCCISEAFEKSYKKNSSILNLVSEDYRVLNDFFKTLQSSGVTGQERIFAVVLDGINVNYKEAKKNEKENIKLYRTLGISIGAMLAIFFI